MCSAELPAQEAEEWYAKTMADLHELQYLWQFKSESPGAQQIIMLTRGRRVANQRDWKQPTTADITWRTLHRRGTLPRAVSIAFANCSTERWHGEDFVLVELVGESGAESGAAVESFRAVSIGEV